MEFCWNATKENTKPYKDFVESYTHHHFVKTRIAKNVNRVSVRISMQKFWKALVGCFLSTQQRSGRGSRIDLFLRSDNQILDINYCLEVKNLRLLVQKTLSKHGIRRNKQIADEIFDAINFLKNQGWSSVHLELKKISKSTSVESERAAADFFQRNFKGIGPKQSRNLIQWMGLSQYEIPIDSRIVKVLRHLNFPVPLSSKALADESYYRFIEDGIFRVLEKIDVLPCVFDACAFASFEVNVLES